MLSAQNDLISGLKLGENEQNCYSILARLFPGQTATSVMAHRSTEVKKETIYVTCSPANSTLQHLATPPLQQEPGIARQWELLSRPLPPIDTRWSDEDAKFHSDISQIKKKVQLLKLHKVCCIEASVLVWDVNTPITPLLHTGGYY